MNQPSDVFDLYANIFETKKQTEMSLRDYLNLCREKPTTFATAAERMVASGLAEFSPAISGAEPCAGS